MRITLLTVFILAITTLYAQESVSVYDRVTNFPDKLFNKVDKRMVDLEKDLDHQTEKYLDKLEKKEARLKRKLYRIDSAKAAPFFANNADQQYIVLLQKLKNQTATEVHSMGPEYLPYTDSLNTSLNFLSKNSQILGSSKILPGDIQNSLAHVKQLQAKLLDADNVKAFVQQRKEQIRQFLTGQMNMPSEANSFCNSYSKELYYYSQRIRKYREALNDPDKMLKEALTLLNKLPAFASFMKQNSFLAGLFSFPSNYGTADGLIGLQTRDQVLALIQSQIGQGGPNAASALQNSLQTARQDITNIQNKISAMGAGNGNIDMPNFKPNQQKTKSFLQRLEYGTNLQTTHGAYYMPSTSDMGLSVGYKINDNSTAGLGASYKLGWGTDIHHINMSSQGAGLRSFVDIKAKKSFYVSGGFEYNYQPIAGQYLQTLNSWQQSGLVGISKIVSMSTKVFKKTKVQLLWDFLSYQQIPKSQPFKFRLGYIF